MKQAEPIVASSRGIFVKRDEKDRPHFIVPRAYLDNREHSGVTHGMARQAHYLVLGYPELSTLIKSDRVLHFITFSVGHADQVMEIDIGALQPKAKQRQAKISLMNAPA